MSVKYLYQYDLFFYASKWRAVQAQGQSRQRSTVRSAANAKLPVPRRAANRGFAGRRAHSASKMDRSGSAGLKTG